MFILLLKKTLKLNATHHLVSTISYICKKNIILILKKNRTINCNYILCFVFMPFSIPINKLPFLFHYNKNIYYI